MALCVGPLAFADFLGDFDQPFRDHSSCLGHPLHGSIQVFVWTQVSTAGVWKNSFLICVTPISRVNRTLACGDTGG
jgi:hypothetical protein